MITFFQNQLFFQEAMKSQCPTKSLIWNKQEAMTNGVRSLDFERRKTL